MSQPPYRALRVVLGFLSLLFAIGGVLMILSNKPIIMRMFMHPPESEMSTLLLAAVKEMGGLALMVGAMLFLAARDPERNVTIIDALVALEVDDIQTRQGHWAIVDLIGKGGHIRTVPIPQWVKDALDAWTSAAGITDGRIFRAVGKMGRLWGEGISQNVVWYVVKGCCAKAGLDHIAPHDLRRTCAKLCHSNGGELEQIQFLLGHASVQTTERYLGCKQNLGHPVNDRFVLSAVMHG